MMSIKKMMLSGSVIFLGNVHAMQMNYGITTSYNVSITTGYFTNHGAIYALNNLTMDVKSLSGNGSISASTANITCNEFSFNGTLTCTDTCAIATQGPFQGKSTIEAPSIEIQCDEFNFTGTLACNKTCTIFAKKMFNPALVTKAGTGTFTVVISPYRIEKHSVSSLVHKMKTLVLNDVLLATDKDIDNAIKKIRHFIHTNNLNEHTVLNAINEALKDAISYHADRLDQQRDNSKLYIGLRNCGISALSVAIGTLAFTYREPINQKLQTAFTLNKEKATDICIPAFGVYCLAALGISSALIPQSIKSFREGLYPRHTEHHERLLFIQSTFLEGFAAPYVSEQQIFPL
ncbi:hypothetical protein H0W26_01455 [Candidatus Dependentiae bacterium]|nr:hypothetical protein [Candidatus Dependentiae bacterium]